MSSKAIAWAFRTQASPSSKLVLLNLSDNADCYGRLRFSLPQVAEECCLSLAETQKYLDELIERKIIFLDPSDIPQEVSAFPWLHAQLLIHRSGDQ